MPKLERDGVALHYEERGGGDDCVVLVHCWAGSTATMAPQAEHLARSHRVISIDLRGHGLSDAPLQDYPVEGFAEDVEWMCAQLGLQRPALVGHSLGGSVVLSLAARYPERARAALILEGLVVAPPAIVDAFRPVCTGVRGPEGPKVVRGFLDQLLGPHFDPIAKQRVLDQMCATPHHVLQSALGGSLEFDSAAAAAAVKVPLLYVSSGPWYTDVERFRGLCPQLVTAQLVGCGHYFELEVPEQLNPMLDRFLRVYCRE